MWNVDYDERPDLHPNTLEFLRLMNKVDWDRWWKNHPYEDFGQYVRRRAEESGSVEGDYPSDDAMRIARRMVGIYRKKVN